MEKRLTYLDRLKVFMTVLVVFHHTAVTYGGAGSWFYYERGDNIGVNTLLSMFTAVNQSFFMGLFFFISGYVTPASYDRHGAGRFLKVRLLRLGVPLLFYMMLIAPLLRYVSGGYKGSLGAYIMTEAIPHPLRGIAEFSVGPLWYVEALLLFLAVYAGYRLLARGKPRFLGGGKPLALTPRLIAGYAVTVAAANFLIRLAYPVGSTVLNLQLAYFPAYIGLFMGGIAAYRGNWLQQLTEAAARRWKWAAIGLVVMMAAGMALGGAMKGDIAVFMGGLNWQSAYYAVLDPVLGLAISYALLVSFRERWNGPVTGMTRWLSANAFLVYIVHALFVTYVAYALRHLDWNPLVKFGAVGCAAVLLSYVAAALIRRIPAVKKVV